MNIYVRRIVQRCCPLQHYLRHRIGGGDQRKTQGRFGHLRTSREGHLHFARCQSAPRSDCDHEDKQNKYKVSARFQIALADYKVTGASGIVGSVGKTIDIKVQLKGKS